jgi:proline dehydrogenase
MERGLESEVLERGRELLARAHRINRRSLRFPRRYWEEKVLDMIMRREALKVQLLRYIDTFPALKTYGQRLDHLVQYLEDDRVLKDKTIRLFFSLLKIRPVPLHVLHGMATSIGVSLFAHKFIAGTSPREALNFISGLIRKKMTCTLDILGEAVLSEMEAEQYTKRYVDLLDDIGRALAKSDMAFQLNVSVKPSSFYSQFKPSAPDKTAGKVCERLHLIMKKAKELNAFVNLDMEQYDYREVTLKIFEMIASNSEFKEYPYLGMVIQAYLKDVLPFTARVIEFARRRQSPFTVRLVKGAYWDYEIINARQREWEIPVNLQKWQTDARFEQLTRILLDSYPFVTLAIGSHNVRSISHAMAYAEKKSVAKSDLEFQLLYGMGDDIKESIVEMGYPVRIYAPYGELIPGMAYLVRRILENTSNESFLRQRSAGRMAAEELLRNPLELARDEHERNQFVAVPQ